MMNSIVKTSAVTIVIVGGLVTNDYFTNGREVRRSKLLTFIFGMWGAQENQTKYKVSNFTIQEKFFLFLNI